jgi:hypothetical protein
MQPGDIQIPLMQYTGHSLVDFARIKDPKKVARDTGMIGPYLISEQPRPNLFGCNPNHYHGTWDHYVLMVQEVKPRKQLIYYKEGKADFLNHPTHSIHLELPYQFYVWGLIGIKNINTNKISYRINNINVLFSPYAWNDESTYQSDLFYYHPWLPNLVYGYGVGKPICYTSKARGNQFFEHLGNIASIKTFQRKKIGRAMVLEYDDLFSQVFNADAGGILLRSNKNHTKSLKGFLGKLSKYSSEEVLDSKGEVYTQHAFPEKYSIKAIHDAFDLVK